MIKRISYLVLAVFATAFMFLGISAPTMAAAKDDVCAGVAMTGGGACDATASTSVSRIVKLIVNILSWVVGVIAVIMIVIGGFKYVTSGGNDSSVASAKNTILYAIVGLVIVAFAQVIVRFVLNKVG